MTNEEIIFRERIELMKKGILQPTGRVVKIPTTDGKVLEFQEPEQIHTFQTWKELGYKVKKGEHAITKVTIWKHVADNTDEDGAELDGHCFMKTAHFFKREQVEKIQEAKA